VAKNILALALFLGCLALIFRIFDLGVTITYLKDELAQAQGDSHTISKFQRNSCSSVYGKIDGVTIFRKANRIVVNRLEFECKASRNGGEELLFLVGKEE
jgi:hypothetical protein